MKNHSFVPSKLFRLVFVSILVIVFSQSFVFSQYLLPSVLDERGNAVQLHFPPPDSNYIHNEIIIYFRPTALRLDSLCYYLPAPITRKNQTDEPLSLPKYFWSNLMTQQFFVGNLLTNSNLKLLLMNLGGVYLKRITPANPCIDTISITRYGDTISCDDYLWMTLHFNNDTSAVTAVVQLLMYYQSDIIWAGLNGLYKPHSDSIPINDNKFNLQTSLHDTISGFQHVWMRQVGNPAIKIAVIDDGLDYHHCDFGGDTFGFGLKVVDGRDYTESTAPWDFSSLSVHGTPVAGIIGALTDSGSCASAPRGVSGIAGGWGHTDYSPSRGYGCSLYGFRTVEYFGSHAFQEPSNIYIESYLIGAIREASNGGYGKAMHVINMSLGQSDYDESIRAAINYANQNGVSVVVSRGNQGVQDTVYPACYDNEWVTSVGASKRNKQKVDDYGSYGLKMDLIAPGGICGGNTDAIVYTTQTTKNNTKKDSCNCFSGTSAAAPHVAGLIALLRSEALDSNWKKHLPFGDDLEPEDYEGMVKAGALDIDSTRNLSYSTGYDRLSGWGHLQADSLFDMLYNGYKLFHFNVTTNLDTSRPWIDTVKQFQYLLNQGYKKPYWLDSNLYKVTRREVRGTINLPNWWLINSTHKLYVWGRSGKGAKSGYSFSTLNYQNGYTRVLSGSGGDNTVDGIYHSDSLHVSVLTYQYDVWNKTGLTHIGHMPPDNQLGCNISVFGDSVLITSVAESENNQSTITTNLYPNPIKNNTNLQIILNEPSTITFNLFNLLGVNIKDFNYDGYYTGIQTFNLDLNGLTPGIYFLRINVNSEIKVLKLIINGE